MARRQSWASAQLIEFRPLLAHALLTGCHDGLMR
jgi:hypothetical protein